MVINEVLLKAFVNIATQTEYVGMRFEAILTEVTTKGEGIRTLEQEIIDLETQKRELEN